MPKKSTKLNGFGLFLQAKSQEWKCSMQNATPKASVLWNRMSKEEKAKYGNKNEEKYTTSGEKVSSVENKQRMEKAEKDSEIAYLNSLMDLPIDDVLNKPFHVMAVNTYCKTELYTNFSELCIAEFSLKNGCHKVENIILGYQPRKLGYDNEIKLGAKECGIEPPPIVESNKNVNDVLGKIQGILKNNQLYTRQETLVKAIIEDLCYYTSEQISKFKIYSLDELFFRLRNICAKDEDDKYPQLSIAEALLNKQPYIYEGSIACSYHKKLEDTYFKCTSSYVIDSIYSICLNCCPFADIPLKSGSHKP